jgi:DNA-binding response OmpR family regulator
MATILIVDDARSTLRALEVILKREGYAVLTAVSGEEGLTCIEGVVPGDVEAFADPREE